MGPEEMKERGLAFSKKLKDMIDEEIECGLDGFYLLSHLLWAQWAVQKRIDNVLVDWENKLN